MGAFDKYEGTASEEGEFPADWKGNEAGDSITGRIANVREKDTKFGTKVIVGLKTAEGDVEFWMKPHNSAGGLTPAMEAFQASGADIGDTVTITLEELKDVGKGNPMKMYSVAVVDDDAAEELFGE